MTLRLDSGARRRVALLGVVAILIQAVLFGWHHHALALPALGDPPIAAVAKAAGPSSPAAAEDGCEICAALHHLSAAPGELVSLALPPIAASAPHLPALVLAARTSDRGFQARAPPRAQHHCV
jgi:hypothetical protein